MTGDRYLAVFMFALGAILLYATSRLEEIRLMDPLGHKSFPYIVAIGAFIAGSLLLFETRRDKKSPKSADIESHPLAVMGVLGWMLLMYIFFNILGFAVSMALLLFGLMLFFNPGKWVTNIALAVTFSYGFHLFFNKLIGTPLPAGLFKFLNF
jgi:hypothetical protein